MWKNAHPVYSAGIRIQDLQNMSLLPKPLDRELIVHYSLVKIADAIFFYWGPIVYTGFKTFLFHGSRYNKHGSAPPPMCISPWKSTNYMT